MPFSCVLDVLDSMILFTFKFGVSVFAFSFRSHLCKIRAQQIYTNTIFGKCSKASRAAVLFEWSMIKVTPAPRTVLSCINSKIASQAPPNAAQRSPTNLQIHGKAQMAWPFFHVVSASRICQSIQYTFNRTVTG